MPLNRKRSIKIKEKTYATHQAKAELSKLIRESLAGIRVTIAKGKEPLVTLVPVKPKQLKRQLGIEKGRFYMADDFNQPISDFDDYVK